MAQFLARPAASGEAWTVDDLIALPDDGYRYEIFDGTLLVAPPPALRHFGVAVRLVDALKPLAPPGVLVSSAGGSVLIRGGRSYLIPDVLVVRDAAVRRTPDALGFDPVDVLVVVEVLSSSNRGRDLVLKRHEYAAAGIGTYWIVDSAGPTLTVLRHDGEGHYDEVATVKPGERWEADEPFPHAVDPAEFA
jgi:Uma2 family endonuclease